MLEQKRLFKLAIVFGWINQNNDIINQILLTKEFCSLNQKFGCPYNNHILWLNQPKFRWFNQTFFWVYGPSIDYYYFVFAKIHKMTDRQTYWPEKYHFFHANNVKKGCESGFPYCFLTDFTKFFLQGSTLLDFGFLTEKASWIHRIFIIWCHDKKKSN